MKDTDLGRAFESYFGDLFDTLSNKYKVDTTPSVEQVLADVEDTAVEDDLLNRDLEQLIEDSDQYVRINDVAASNSPFLLESVKKIRDRWGISETLMVGQESFADSFKEMLRRFIAWLKEKAKAVTDLWFKFNNLGKAAKRRSKKFKVQIMQCRHRNKDYVTGTFIMRLMVGSEFVGGDIQAMKNVLADAKETVEAQKRLHDAIVAEVDKDLSGKPVNYAAALSMDKMYGTTAKSFNIVGHRTLFAQMYFDEEDRAYARLAFPPTLKEDIPPHVFTPKLQLLERLNDFYYILGRDLEREINKQQFIEKTHIKLAATMEKLMATIERAENDPKKVNSAKRAAKYARIASSKAATINSVGHFAWRNLTAGLGAYIQESIRAFSK